MSFPHFFIGRPVFAAVLSIVIVLVGSIALITLPVAQYPEIVPPTIQVSTSYPGANAQVVAETVALAVAAAPVVAVVAATAGVVYAVAKIADRLNL